ncbi:ROK family protein [Nonomuraea sp. ATR24]|uniref:ROK family transcriptional regulator n=1 Tax=Nonomuraea TaxID=83681 RepID=UPI001C5F023F|nr:ROK family protein [Nonomuraea ceibae]
MSTGNPTVFRTLNERTALTLLLEHGALTRAELETHTGLSKASAAEVLRRLENSGLARKAGHKPGNAGPAAQMWALDGSAARVAGVDLTTRSIEVSVADLTGRVLGGHRTEATGDARLLLEETLAAAGFRLDELDQVVVGVPGIVEAEGRRLRQAVQLAGWTGLDDLPGHVRLENDVNLVAIREQQEHQDDSFVLFWVGAGVGAGAVLDGTVWRGVTGRGGEVGSVIVPDPVSKGRVYGHDGGPLGALLGAEPLAALAAAHGVTAEPTLDGAGRALREADPRFLSDVAARVALGVSAAIGVLDPGLVVLAGPLCIAGGEPLRALVAGRLAETPLVPVTVALSAVDGNAVLDGALCYALDLTRERVFQAGTAGRTGESHP